MGKESIPHLPYPIAQNQWKKIIIIKKLWGCSGKVWKEWKTRGSCISSATLHFHSWPHPSPATCCPILPVALSGRHCKSKEPLCTSVGSNYFRWWMVNLLFSDQMWPSLSGITKCMPMFRSAYQNKKAAQKQVNVNREEKIENRERRLTQTPKASKKFWFLYHFLTVQNGNFNSLKAQGWKQNIYLNGKHTSALKRRSLHILADTEDAAFTCSCFTSIYWSLLAMQLNSQGQVF